MDKNINFPHLGIFLENVGKSVSIGGFEIAYYGIIIGCAFMIGLLIAMRRARETGQNPEKYVDFFIYLMIFSILGARIYYVAFSFDNYRGHLIDVFNLRQGGLAIYGGIIGGVVTSFVFAKVNHMKGSVILDTIIMGVCNGQILGRWGNFFNREAFGEYTDGLFAMQLPVSAVRPHEITALMKEHEVLYNGVQYIQVHPTFLYEGMWNALVLLVLFLTRNKTKFDGELFLRYLIGYGIGRFFIEQLRTDQLQIGTTGIPVSQLLSALLVAGSVILTVICRRKKQTEAA